MAEQLPSGRRVPTALPPAVRGAGAPPSGIEPPPDLREWFAVVRRHLRLASCVAAAVFAVALYLVYTSPEVYRATSVVRLVDARRALVGREAAVGSLTGRLLVRPRENTDVIDIGFTASDPERAQEVANRVARVFQTGNARTAQQEARRRREFIETQLRFNDSLLAEARGALGAFRAKAPGLAGERSAGPSALEGRRQELDVERRQYASVLGQLRDTNRVTRRAALRNMIAASATIGGNTGVARLYDQLVRYETQRDSLTSGDWARAATNPDVQRLVPLIASTEADLVGAVRSVVASLDARIAGLDDLQARSGATALRLSTAPATDV